MHNFVQTNSLTSLEHIQASLHMIYAIKESPKENPEVISYIFIKKNPSFERENSKILKFKEKFRKINQTTHIFYQNMVYLVGKCQIHEILPQKL